MGYVSFELKARVAENCNEYNSRNPWSFSNMGSISQSCDSCSNFVKGQCSKDLFDSIAKAVTIN